MTTLTIALGRYEELVLYSTQCGEFLESDYICDNSCCNNSFNCFAGKNFLREIDVI